MVDYEKVKELDRHWKEVMDLAQQYGFIGYAYGGTAVLLTHRNQLEARWRRQIFIPATLYVWNRYGYR